MRSSHGQFGLDELQFVLLFGGSAVALIGGAQLNPPLLRRFGPHAIASAASAAVGGIVLALTAGRRREPDVVLQLTGGPSS